MDLSFKSYFVLAILGIVCLILQLSFARLPFSFFIINLPLIYFILLCFWAPFWFYFIFLFIISLIFDIFYFNLWGVNFLLFLVISVLIKSLLLIFEKKSFFSWLVIGELLIFIYFFTLFFIGIIFKYPIPFLKIFFSSCLNGLLYFFLLNSLLKKLYYFK